MLKFVIKLKRINFHAKARHVGVPNGTFSEKDEASVLALPL